VNWPRIFILVSPAKRAGTKILQNLRNETEHNERITEQKLLTDIARLPAHDADARGSVPVSNTDSDQTTFDVQREIAMSAKRI